MIRTSLRLRLAVAFTLLVATTLVLVGVVTYQLLRNGLLTGIERDVAHRAAAFAADPTVRCGHFGAPDVFLQISDLAGNPVARSGNLGERVLPVPQPARRGEVVEVRLAGRPLFLTAAPLGDDRLVVVARSPVTTYGALRELQQLLIFVVGGADFEQLLAISLPIARRWLSSVAQRLAASQNRLMSLLGRTLTEQVARLLLDESVDGQACDHGQVVRGELVHDLLGDARAGYQANNPDQVAHVHQLADHASPLPLVAAGVRERQLDFGPFITFVRPKLRDIGTFELRASPFPRAAAVFRRDHGSQQCHCDVTLRTHALVLLADLLLHYREPPVEHMRAVRDPNTLPARLGETITTWWAVDQLYRDHHRRSKDSYRTCCEPNPAP